MLHPSDTYVLNDLKNIQPPPSPPDFTAFWSARYRQAMQVQPHPKLYRNSEQRADFDVYDLNYQSINDVQIRGWALIPKHKPVIRGVVVGHGYGGRDAPDFHLPITNCAFLFPCFRGLARSQHPAIPSDPNQHALHGLDNKDHYILGGCVADVWLAVSALLDLFPQVNGHVGYLGISFGGGIGALALPWDRRIQRAHFNVPTFGNQPLRLKLPTWGSAAAVQAFHNKNPHLNVPVTLSYYDAACAAQQVHQPVHIAAALSDPVVTPPGQFSIYNALQRTKQLFVLKKGHADYPEQAAQERALLLELNEFFAKL